MIREAISRVVAGDHLTQDEAGAVMAEIMGDEVTPAQFGALVTALRLKGETVDEIAGFAGMMRDRALPVTLPPGGVVVDTCGTGGDSKGTFNVSTAAAIVVAAVGYRVAKHGNRAASSLCGSADVLEALGVPISLSPPAVAASIAEVGIAFMLAPLFHPATRFAVGPRREIGIRTVFNILGPLTNPARVTAQVLGVPDAGLVEKMAAVLGRLGARHALVVRADDGMDELSVSAPTTVCELHGGAVRTYRVSPEDLGLQRAAPSAIAGGGAQENAALMIEVLDGTASQALRDVVALNAAAALIACEGAAGFPEGIALAREAMESGAARAKLEQWRHTRP